MNTISTALTRPRSSSGVTRGRIVCRSTTLHHVDGRRRPRARAATATSCGRGRRRRCVTPKSADDEQQRPARHGAAPAAAPGSSGRAERPDGRRGAEHAEAGRADVEHVLREDGQQRDGAAEEDGEEVERDRAEQHGRAPDEPHAAEDALEVRRRAAGRLRGPAAAASTHPASDDERERRRPTA